MRAVGSRVLTHVPPEQRAAQDAERAAGIALDRALSAEISANDLTPAQKQRVWAYLKQHHPERVAFLMDPAIRALSARGAVPTFPREIVRAALQPNPMA